MSLKYLSAAIIALLITLASCKTVEPVVVPIPPTNLEKIHSEISQTSIKAHLEFLASDALKGRDTGSEGLEAAAVYVASHFRRHGLKEVGGTYFQGVPFVSFAPPASATMITDGIELSFPDDFIAINGTALNVETETVFIGFGSDADLEGVDLTGKIAVSKAGDGVSTAPIEWVDMSRTKRQRVIDAGGIALVEIYQSRAIPWRFLRSLGTSKQTTVDDGKSNTDLPNLWVGTSDSLTIANLENDGSPLKIAMGEVKRDKFTSDNVMAMIPGTDPTLNNEYIVYSAHYDHVGVGKADADGDTIYNGTRDNAIGTSGILSLAQYFSQNPPKRSSLFVLFTGEEKGLLGSRHFTENLPVEASDIKFNLNIDNAGYNDTTLVTIFGMNRTGMADYISAAAQEVGLSAIEDPAPEQNLFDRSDNVNFAVLGIPAPTYSMGFTAFDADIFKYYHQAGDELETVNLNYVEKYIKSYMLTAISVANADSVPFWVQGDKYYDAGVELYGLIKE